MTTKENNTVVENEVMFEPFEKNYWQELDPSIDGYDKIHEEKSSDDDIDPTYDAILDGLCDKLDKVFEKNAKNSKVYHRRVICIFTVLYSFMTKTNNEWEVNIEKCKLYNVELMYETSEILAKTLENSVNQEKLSLKDIAIYMEINDMLDALNEFIARCGSASALASDESFRKMHNETIDELIENIDKHVDTIADNW